MARRWSGNYGRDLNQFRNDLLAVVDEGVIHKRLADKHGVEIIKAVIGAAKAGIGPDNKRFPAYSASYTKALQMRGRTGKGGIGWSRKQAAKSSGSLHERIAAGNKLWLTLSGVMLDPANFSFEVRGDKLFLVWTSPGTVKRGKSTVDVGVYAEVHQEGLPMGKNGPRKKRTWMHIESTLAANATLAAYDATFRELAAQFAANRTPR